MYVLDEDDYKDYKRYKAGLPPPEVKPEEPATCPIDGRVYPQFKHISSSPQISCKWLQVQYMWQRIQTST